MHQLTSCAGVVYFRPHSLNVQFSYVKSGSLAGITVIPESNIPSAASTFFHIDAWVIGNTIYCSVNGNANISADISPAGSNVPSQGYAGLFEHE